MLQNLNVNYFGTKLFIEAFDFNQKVDLVTIGYYLNRVHWGKGIATEAIGLLANVKTESPI